MKEDLNMTDLAIIGAGPAGLTAAIYALRAGINVKIFEKNIYGGQTAIIDRLENYPGFESINGVDFANLVYNQTEKLGAEFIFSKVVKLDLLGNEKYIYTEDGEKVACKAVLISNGLKRRHLGCKGEAEFSGKGVSYCATCDGAFFKSKNVLIVGGGNTALEDALYLSNICSKVTMIVRKDCFRGESVLAEEVKNNSKIEIKFSSQLEEIKGEKFVNSAIIKNKDGNLSEISVEGVFIAIGYEPDKSLYENQILTDEQGYFIADETCETNLPGVYVAGDCRKKPLRQIITAASDGAVAGNKAAEYILRISAKK